MRYSSIVRRNLDAVAVVCLLLWAVSGLSVLGIALHGHFHHAEPHDHHDALQAALHGHAHEGSPDHDHELSALLNASRSPAAPHPQVMTSRAPLLQGSEASPLRAVAASLSGTRNHGPPSYLMHCVLLI